MAILKIISILIGVFTAAYLIIQYLSRKEKQGMSRVVITPRKGPIHDFYNYTSNPYLAVGAFEAGKMPECFEEFDLVINCSTIEFPKNIPTGKEYLCLGFLDKDGKSFREVIEPTIDKIHKYVMKEKNVLIHCVEGKSRSVGIALAYLVSTREIKESRNVFVILEHEIRRYRPIADPEQAFIDEIFDFLGRHPMEKPY